MKIKKLKQTGIFPRTFMLSALLSLLIIFIFSVAMIPRMKESSVQSLRNQARSVSASIAQVCGNAIVSEDYSFIVEHNLEVINGSPDIFYVIVTRRDGFSLIHTSSGWKQVTDFSNFSDASVIEPMSGQIIPNMILEEDQIFHYVYPLNYSGLDWGTLHVGLSVEKLHKEIYATYKIVFFLGLICLVIGLAGALFFATKITNPILKLRDITRTIAEGELGARVDISTGDEIEELAISFNTMSERLEKTTVSKNYVDNIFQQMNECLIIVDKDLLIKTVNRATLLLLNYSNDEIVNLPLSNVIAHGRGNKNTLMRALKNNYLHKTELLLTKKDSTRVPVMFTSSTLTNNEGHFEGIICVAFDLTERFKAEEEIRAKEEQYKTLVRTSPDSVVSTDLEGIINYVSPRTLEMHGYETSEELLGENALKLLDPEHHDLAKENLKKTLSEGSIKNIPYTMIKKDKTQFIGELSASLIIDQDGEPQGFIETVRDITERKAAEEKVKESLKEKVVLLREVHHRVKNNMQVISSLLKLQSDYIQDEKSLELLKESQNRISSMALVHEKLYKSEDLAKIRFTEYVRNLTDNLINYSRNGNGHKNIIISKNVDDISLGVDAAIPCGLIINELITNSLKHAYPDRDQGKINIEFRKNGDDTLKLLIEDDGVGIPEDLDITNTDTLGMRLVGTLVRQLHGTIDLDRTQGTQFIIHFQETL